MPLKKFRDLSHYNQIPSILSYWDKSFTCRFASLYFSKWFNGDHLKIVGKTTLAQLFKDSYHQHLPFLNIVSKGIFQCYECEMDLFMTRRCIVILTYYPEFDSNIFVGFYLHMQLKGQDFIDNLKTNNNLYLKENKMAVVGQFLKTQILNDFPSIEYLASKHLLSVSKLMRDFKSTYNTSPFTYYRNLQMEFAMEYMNQTCCSKKQIALMLGFSNPGNFTTCYKKWERAHLDVNILNE